jgi:hypothetical protein
MSILSREQCTARLRRTFPEEVVDDRVVYGSLAGAAVFVCLYVDAVDGARKIRPSTVLWMCDGAARWHASGRRDAWYRAAMTGHGAVRQLLTEQGIDHRPWYAENSRETLRDEVFRSWSRLGAIERDEAIPTTSSKPAWSLPADFAALFDSGLRGKPLEDRIAAWQNAHLGTVGLTRRAISRQRAQAGHSVSVRLPSGAHRSLRPGDSSLILKGVIEALAPRIMDEPAVLAISESARKADLLDQEILKSLGITITPDRLLPDALLFDAASGTFWFVEAVATDGEINEGRRGDLLRWADAQGIDAEACGFVTAFRSRTQNAFRRRVSAIAWSTLVWFLYEPDRVFRLEELPALEA